MTHGGALLGLGLAAGLFAAPLAYGAAGFFGASAFGSAIFLSALLPTLAVLGLMQFKPLRGALVGLSLGWSALLLHGAIVLPTLLTGVPGGAGWDRVWLLANAGLSFLLARRLVRSGDDGETTKL